MHLLTGVTVDGQFITLTSVYSKVRIRQHVACVHLQQLITVVSRCAHISQSRDCIDRLPWSRRVLFPQILERVLLTVDAANWQLTQDTTKYRIE